MNLLRTALNLGQSVLDMLYAPSCMGCGENLFGCGSSAICARCEGKIRFHDSSCCSFCGTAAGDFATLGHGCSRCRPSTQQFTRAVGAVRYDTPSREMVHSFKYYQSTFLAESFANAMVSRLHTSDFPKHFDTVLPVPLHRKRLRWRGYNQSELLARKIAEKNGWPISTSSLRRVKNTTAQALLLPVERRDNIRGAFATEPGSFSGQTVLLVDDVMTTGHTVSECAGVLRAAGAKHIYVLVFAR